MEDWVREQGFIKETDMADYLREQRYHFPGGVLWLTAESEAELGAATSALNASRAELSSAEVTANDLRALTHLDFYSGDPLLRPRPRIGS